MPAASPAPEWIAASVAKRGNRPGENEDATAASPDGLRFAACDGATEGWESGPWAARLAGAFVAKPPEPVDFADWLASARDWAPDALEGTQPWYVTEKQEQGSFATLLGLELRRSQSADGWAWRAVAVGDTCLFHLRGDELAQAFPLESAASFGNRPALVPSAHRRCPEPEWGAGRANPGDLFLMATDAAAARLFDPDARAAAAKAALAALAARDPAALAEWCKGVQDVANDDVTVVAIRLPPVAA
jgi:serine/threonine protein phosphatase PrpC